MERKPEMAVGGRFTGAASALHTRVRFFNDTRFAIRNQYADVTLTSKACLAALASEP